VSSKKSFPTSFSDSKPFIEIRQKKVCIDSQFDFGLIEDTSEEADFGLVVVVDCVVVRFGIVVWFIVGFRLSLC